MVCCDNLRTRMDAVPRRLSDQVTDWSVPSRYVVKLNAVHATEIKNVAFGLNVAVIGLRLQARDCISHAAPPGEGEVGLIQCRFSRRDADVKKFQMGIKAPCGRIRRFECRLV